MNAASVANSSALLLSIISGLDDLLGTNPNYLLGKWTTDATSQATSKNESDLFMYNARNQITLWGPTGQITDYAAKAWHGLYGDYYLMRWQMMVESVLQQGVQTWNSYSFQYDLLQAEEGWCANTTAFPAKVTGKSSLAVAQRLMAAMTGNLSDYTVMQNSAGGNPNGVYQPMWTTRPEQLATRCDIDPACDGFDSNGYTRSGVAGSVYSQQGTTLYVKRTKAPTRR